MFNTGRVVYMAQNLVLKSGLQLFTCLIKQCKLLCGEVVKVIAIRPYEMRKHRARNDGILMFQPFYQPLHVIIGIKSKPMHARIQLDMNRIVGDTLFLGSLDECFQ